MVNAKKASAVFFLLTAFFILKSAATACAAQADFYGVKMSSEYYVKDLTVDESGPAPGFNVDKPGMDKRIYATATLSGRNFKIQVFNHSDETIQSDTDYAEYIVVTHDGERYFLKRQPMAWMANNTIAPNKNATFEPFFDGRSLKKEDIRAVICSFDLGEMKIILLPLSKRREVAAVKAPAPVKKPKPTPAVPAQSKPPKEIKSVPAAPVKQTKAVPTPPIPKKEAKAPAKPAISLEERVEKMLSRYPDLRKPGQEPRVEEVDPESKLIVVNRGFEDGLREGSLLSIVRDGLWTGEATIRQLKNGYAVASIVSGGGPGHVQADDAVVFFDL